MSEREFVGRRATRRWVMVIGLVVVGLVGLVGGGVAFFFQGEREPRTFASAIRRGEAAVVLHEGLPHPVFEAALLERERVRAGGAVEELHGYAFYQEPLALTGEEARQITEVMASPGRYLPFSGEKKCGGFHPDYAVEWRRGGEVYTALVCFGCEEVKLFGPGMASRHDMGARGPFIDVLGGRRKNRPAGADY